MSDAASTERPKHTNRLADESSPYLLQHAHNPVDWHPWGPAAFEIARREHKPIFLSVGYSTCYWCHVMERQSFENEAVAAEMNARFVNIKVDREERPDVDQLYMTAVQVLTRHGGWPMSVFLTPDLRPFYGGTYFPPTDMHGRPGFVTILRGIEDAYRNRPTDVAQTAGQLVDILQRVAEPSAPQTPLNVDGDFVLSLIRRSIADYDPRHGGFGGAPKFPRETLLELLLVFLQNPQSQIANQNSQIADLKSDVLNKVRHTLDALAEGGIRDQLGGGFHRYSTDARWLVPHFEIMLYDNAMLAWCYAEAFRQTGEARYAAVARGVCDFVLREMTSPEGAFYTALDAEVDGQEGLNYLWTTPEVVRVLGPDDARLFNQVYGLDRGPNFADPHHGTGTPDKNILFLPRPMRQVAEDLKLDVATLESRLAPMGQALYVERMKRKQPLLDTKVITSWAALMVRALAHCGKTLGEPRYVEAAGKSADFLMTRHRRPAGAGGGLFRTSREEKAKYAGFLDDYAFLAQALLALFDATGAERWSAAAGDVAAMMVAQFGDPAGGGFYFTAADATDLIVRQKTATDSPLPSGNAIAAMVLLEMGQAAETRKALAAFAQAMDDNGEGMSAMVHATLMYLRKAEPFTVSAQSEEDETAGSSGADRPLSPQQMAQGVVTMRTAWHGDAELAVTLSVLRGFHINSHVTRVDVPVIATRLQLTDEADAATADVRYPAGEALRTAFADSPFHVYGGEVTIFVRFRAPRRAGPPVRMTLTYQACDESACLPPVTRAIEVEGVGG